jgi:sucrose:sucrose fructosyltransferase
METRDPSSLPYSYTPLPAADDASAEVTGNGSRGRGRSLAVAALVISGALLLAGVRPLLLKSRTTTGMDDMATTTPEQQADDVTMMSRGPNAGVSEKTSGADDRVRLMGDSGNAFPWSNAMLRWQRTGFHFQPEKNWMNDPNGEPAQRRLSFLSFLHN